MFLNDQETATDLLYYEAIAKTVVSLIRKTSDAPVTISVHGDWGAGKSSVLKMLEGAFAEDGRVLCLWFNGWTFEGFEDAKTVVIETIVDELRRARPASTKVADASAQADVSCSSGAECHRSPRPSAPAQRGTKSCTAASWRKL